MRKLIARFRDNKPGNVHTAEMHLRGAVAQYLEANRDLGEHGAYLLTTETVNKVYEQWRRIESWTTS